VFKLEGGWVEQRTFGERLSLFFVGRRREYLR
jgi:hypothetical protein